MEKRLILAITLSLLVILLWSGLTPKFYPTAPQGVTEEKPLPAQEITKPLAPEIPQEVKQATLEKVDLPFQEVVFALPAAAIQEVSFKEYQNYSFLLQKGFWLGGGDLAFQSKNLGRESTFIHEDGQKRITKRFIFHNSKYSIGLDITIQNLSNQVLDQDYSLILAKADASRIASAHTLHQVVLAQKEKLLRLNPWQESSSGEELKFMAIADRYFCAIIQPDFSGSRGFITKSSQKESESGLTYNINLSPGQATTLSFNIYIGPQDRKTIAEVNKEWTAVINYGTFDWLSQLLFKILEFFHNLVRNWGLAIILLSLFIYLALFPLTIKQMRSMKQSQENTRLLQPQLEELKKKYKDNPQKLNKESMELYKKYKVFSLGGCLPMILQIPVFIALFQVFTRSLALKNATFWWIKDLSEPDRLVNLAASFRIPLVGTEISAINLLPILVALMMFVQQKLSFVPSSDSAKEQQRMMMFLMPIMMVVVFYNMAAGWLLYFFVNTLLMTLYQFRIHRAK
jgi:YidC/Oxa1 family membrane protein insertase